MSQKNRIANGQVDRATELSFRFNDTWMKGHPGDTLASALLANGQRLVGRSFKYHRPRGILTAGSEEPNALVQLRSGAHQEPNTRATTVELFDGLTATSQNHRGSLEFDLMAVTDLLSPFLSAGFYYKTFMWPRAFWEKLYEPVIRASAGLGSLSMKDDPDRYDKGFAHCDLLVIGAGPSGLAAALAAGRAGARVILADEDFRPGGRLNAETLEVEGMPGADWASGVVAELAAMDNVRLMTRTTVYGAYDHGTYGALERCTDHLADAGGKPRQILWRIYSKRAVLTAGATERPIAFGNNDRPGIMLAGAVRDSRDAPAPVDVPGARHIRGVGVVDTVGRKGIKSIILTDGQVIPVDCLAVSGGWNPNVHLTCHQRGRPVWRDDINAFVPGDALPPGMAVAGAANGALTLAAALAQGQATANTQIEQLGFTASHTATPRAEDEPHHGAAFWHVRQSTKRAWQIG